MPKNENFEKWNFWIFFKILIKKHDRTKKNQKIPKRIRRTFGMPSGMMGARETNATPASPCLKEERKNSPIFWKKKFPRFLGKCFDGFWIRGQWTHCPFLSFEKLIEKIFSLKNPENYRPSRSSNDRPSLRQSCLGSYCMLKTLWSFLHRGRGRQCRRPWG